ncbi:MAG: RpiB/LacA/LacB family sugar-phosphate isomerase, partial [Christensenellales bacterium]
YKDVGCFSEERTDYPLYAKLVCESIQNENDKGILVCGSGIGMSICANRYPHIRASLSINKKMAYLGRHHNNANVLVLQGRNKCNFSNIRILKTFLKETFDGGKHAERVEMLSSINKLNND